MTKDIPAPLSPEALSQLRDLVARIEQHQGPWSTVGGGERQSNGAITMPWVQMHSLAYEAMAFLYDNELVIPFDWPAWEEGRAIFRDRTSGTFERLDRMTVLKLLTAVARNDRFNEGAWADLFDAGDGRRLLKRLLDLEQEEFR
jgi:hypothetical protein